MASRSSFFSDPRPQRRRSVSPPGRSAFSLPDARERKREAARKRVRYDFGHTQRVMTLGDEDGDNTSGASVDDSGFANKDGKHTVTNEDDQVERFRLKRALKASVRSFYLICPYFGSNLFQPNQILLFSLLQGLTRRTRKGLLHLCNALIPRPRLPPSLSTHQTSNGIQYLTPNRDRFPSNPEKDLNAYTNPYPYSGRAR